MYGKTREDFVDVEWEFVNGNLRNDDRDTLEILPQD